MANIHKNIPLKTEFVKVVNESISARQVCRILNISTSCFKMLIQKYKIDYSHFIHGKAYDSMIGKKFGLLIPLHIEKKSINGVKIRPYLFCHCDCGNDKLIRADEVKNGIYTSCGCLSKNRWNMIGDKNPAFKGKGYIRQHHFKNIIQSAKRRNLEFNLDLDYIWQLYQDQNEKCPLTGIHLKFGRIKRTRETTASLDRIDNAQGYIKGNVRWIYKDVNLMRRNFNDDYFLYLCNLIANNCPVDIMDMTNN